jgi:phage recombination protein Bet
MNAPAVVNVNIPSLQMAEEELIRVLESSIYPGAKLESIKLVVGYCKAQNLDPLLKPVHIVPMDVKTGEKDKKGWDVTAKRDVVMPGIGLYRTQAARTGQYAGMSEPEFGPTKTLTFRQKTWVDDQETWADATIEYPEYCRITVTRVVGGNVAKFTATEFWLENYATSGRKTIAPNAMWKKRPRGQLAKCAEAQALRKAFPEFGAQPSAEEMAGKPIVDDEDIIEGTATVVQPPTIEGPRAKSTPKDPPPEPEQPPETTPPAQAEKPAGGTTHDQAAPPKDDKPLTEGQLRIIRAKLKAASLTDVDLEAKFGPIASLKFSQFADIQKWVGEKLAG